jgi:hypothetical protein
VTCEACTLARAFCVGGVREDKTSFIVWSTLLPLSAGVFRCRKGELYRPFFLRAAGEKNMLVMTPEWTVLESCCVAIPALAGIALHVEHPSTMFGMTGETIVLVPGTRL